MPLNKNKYKVVPNLYLLQASYIYEFSEAYSKRRESSPFVLLELLFLRESQIYTTVLFFSFLYLLHSFLKTHIFTNYDKINCKISHYIEKKISLKEANKSYLQK